MTLKHDPASSMEEQKRQQRLLTLKHDLSSSFQEPLCIYDLAIPNKYKFLQEKVPVQDLVASYTTMYS